MSIKIEINKKQLNNIKLSPCLHFIPAKIEGDGEANVEKYFNPYICKEYGVLNNAFRGYPLQGEVLKVSNGYKGLILQETRKPLDESADRTLRIKGSFEEFTYWNYDKIPSLSDSYKQSLQILSIAEVLSEPCTEQDVLKEMEDYKSDVKNNEE